MITASTAFNECAKRSSRTFRARLLKNGQPLDCEVRKVVVRKGACAENFTPGTMFAPYINADVSNLDTSIENEEVLLQIGLLLDDGTVEYTNQGYFTVTKPKRSANQTSFDAVGRISSKLNVLPDLPEEKTLAKLAAAIAAKTGVAIVTNGVNLAGTITKDLNGLTCREILEVVTSVLGGFVTEDGEGNVVIAKYSTASALEYNGDYTTSAPAFNDYNYTLSGIKVIVASEYTDEDGNTAAETAYTDGLPVLTLSNQYMTEELFQAFVQNTVGYSFKPGEIQLALGDPRIEPWDCISFTDIDGSNHVVPCFELTHTFDGGLTTSISAKGESETESSIIVKGPVQKQIERLSADLFTAKEAIVKRLKADEIITEELNAETGTFTKYLTGVKIYGDLIKANTLAADALILKGTDGIYRKLNIDALGQTTVDRDEKYNNGLDGSVLVAESVTADKISVTDLNAFKATIGGFSIGDNSIHSVKTAVNDPAAGVYVGTAGIGVGDGDRYCVPYGIQGSPFEVYADGTVNMRGKNGSFKFDPKTGNIDIVANSFSIGKTSGSIPVIVSTEVTYQVGNSQTDAPTGEWQDAIPTVADGQYLWTKTETTFSDGTTKEDYVVSKQGGSGGDVIIMSITSSEGNVLTSSSDSTVLTAHVFVNGVEQNISGNGVCEHGTVNWYKGGTFVKASNTVTVTGSAVTDSATYTAKLEQEGKSIAKASAETTIYKDHYATLMKFDSTGLTIGDFSKGTLAENVLIRPGGIDLRSGSAVLASFESDAISLGNTSDFTKINMLNSTGNIYVNTTQFGISTEKRFNIFSGDSFSLLARGSSYESSMHAEAGSSPSIYININNRDGSLLNGVAISQTETAFAKKIAVDGESVFYNLAYTGRPTDTASGVGCAFKASRGLFNEALIDKLIMTSSTGKIPFYKYTGTSGGSMTGISEVASVTNDGTFRGAGVSVTGTVSANNATIASSLEVKGSIQAKGGLELYHSSTPYFDFHYGGTTTDYTSRIIETASGTIAVNGVACTSGGKLMIPGLTTIKTRIEPNVDGAQTGFVNLGSPSLRFKYVYASGGVQTSSDLNQKRDLRLLDDRYIKLFDLTDPYAYFFINGDRLHIGFIAQYVEDAFDIVGLTPEECAFFCKDIDEELIYDENNICIERKPRYDEDGNPIYRYSLRYQEYIGIVAAKIKKMEKDHAEEKKAMRDEMEILKSLLLGKIGGEEDETE